MEVWLMSPGKHEAEDSPGQVWAAANSKFLQVPPFGKRGESTFPSLCGGEGGGAQVWEEQGPAPAPHRFLLRTSRGIPGFPSLATGPVATFGLGNSWRFGAWGRLSSKAILPRGTRVSFEWRAIVIPGDLQASP